MRYKLIVLAVIMAALALPSAGPAPALAGQPEVSDYHCVTATGPVVAKAARATAVRIFTDGTNAVTVTLYDNPSAASGEIFYGPHTVSGADGIGGTMLRNLDITGAYAVITTSGTCRVCVDVLSQGY